MYELRIGIDENGIGIDMNKVRNNPVLMKIVDRLMKEEDNVELYFN